MGDRPMMLAAAAGFAAGLAGASLVMWAMRKQELRREDRSNSYSSLSELAAEVVASNGEEFRPPLPVEVKQMLSEATLCHLSCMDSDAPHTSLMNFTFVADEEDIMVLTTRRDTRKYELMKRRPEVSMLLHDFPQVHVKADEQKQSDELNLGKSFKRTLSIGITGIARFETGASAEKYRKIHLDKNPNYAQFIAGEDKAVITVKILRARMCNVIPSPSCLV